MSCAGSTGVGEPVIGSAPDCVLGKAITSRMFSSPARIAMSRSMPKAKPRVGRRAVAERVEEEAEALLCGLVVDAEQVKTRCCTSGSWIRTLPEPSSQPFSTRS